MKYVYKRLRNKTFTLSLSFQQEMQRNYLQGLKEFDLGHEFERQFRQQISKTCMECPHLRKRHYKDQGQEWITRHIMELSCEIHGNPCPDERPVVYMKDVKHGINHVDGQLMHVPLAEDKEIELILSEAKIEQEKRMAMNINWSEW